MTQVQQDPLQPKLVRFLRVVQIFRDRAVRDRDDKPCHPPTQPEMHQRTWPSIHASAKYSSKLVRGKAERLAGIRPLHITWIPEVRMLVVVLRGSAGPVHNGTVIFRAA